MILNNNFWYKRLNQRNLCFFKKNILYSLKLEIYFFQKEKKIVYMDLLYDSNKSMLWTIIMTFFWPIEFFYFFNELVNRLSLLLTLGRYEPKIEKQSG